MLWAIIVIVLAGCVLALSQIKRSLSDQADAAQAGRALSRAAVPGLPGSYDPAMVAGLPEPARRFFNFAIEPGTPIKTVVEITMVGELSLGTKQEPNYFPIQAR